MSLKKVYCCDMCYNEIANPVESFGVFYRGSIVLGSYSDTDNCHVCDKCVKQLKRQLGAEKDKGGLNGQRFIEISNIGI